MNFPKKYVTNLIVNGLWHTESGRFVSYTPKNGDIVEVVGISGDHYILSGFESEHDTFNTHYFVPLSEIAEELIDKIVEETIFIEEKILI